MLDYSAVSSSQAYRSKTCPSLLALGKQGRRCARTTNLGQIGEMRQMSKFFNIVEANTGRDSGLLRRGSCCQNGTMTSCGLLSKLNSHGGLPKCCLSRQAAHPQKRQERARVSFERSAVKKLTHLPALLGHRYRFNGQLLLLPCN